MLGVGSRSHGSEMRKITPAFCLAFCFRGKQCVLLLSMLTNLILSRFGIAMTLPRTLISSVLVALRLFLSCSHHRLPVFLPVCVFFVCVFMIMFTSFGKKK